MVKGLVASPGAGLFNSTHPKEGIVRTYQGYETTPTVAPSRNPIGVIAARISSNPLSGPEILETSSSSLAWQGPDGESLSFRNNEEMEEFLRTAGIVSQKRIGEGINNPLKVLLEKDGIQMHAVFRDVRVEHSQLKMNDGSTKFFFVMTPASNVRPTNSASYWNWTPYHRRWSVTSEAKRERCRPGWRIPRLKKP